MVFDPVLLEARNPSPMTGAGNNTYLLVGASGDAALIDAGVGDPRHLEDIQRHVGRGQLGSVFVTHAHADHMGGVQALATAHRAATFHKLFAPGEDPKYGVAWRPLHDADTVEAGGERLVVVHTPGHSPDHVVFWHESSRTVFGGDLVIPGGSVMIDSSGGGNLGDYLRSLERVLALRPQRLLPAHGRYVNDPARVLAGHLRHRLDRERQVIDSLAAGRDTVFSIAESIYDGLEPALMPAARENVRAHLYKLKVEGRATDADGRWTLSGTT